MKWIDKYSWISNFYHGVGRIILGTALLFTVTTLNAGTFKMDLRGCKAGPDNGYYVQSVPDIHPGHPDFNMYFCDYDAYTEGNLKQWAELDMVPHVIIFSNTTGVSQDFTFAVGGDYKDANNPDIIGWDYITELTLDVAATRAIAVDDGLNPDTVEAACKGVGEISAQSIVISPDESEIFRVVDVTGYPDNLTCVAIYNLRLAIGSSNYSGSSLQSRLITVAGDIKVGDQTLPLSDVISTTFSKTMTAVQGGENSWTVTKTATPATVNFPNTCADDAVLEQDVAITVSWEKMQLGTSGDVSVTTVIKASNTAQRDIGVSVVDTLYSGTTQLDSANCPSVTVTANTADQTVCTNTFTIAAADAVNLNDKAVATFTDPDHPSEPILATLEATATAEVQSSGVNSNESAVIREHEWITGNDLTYSVESVVGASGAFDGYTLGDVTTADVNWLSDSQGDSGSVVFNKKVYVPKAAQTTGFLNDTASLTGSDGFIANDSSLSVNLIANRLLEVTLNTVVEQDIIDQNQDVNFTYDVLNPTGYDRTVVATVPAGQSSVSGTFTDVDPVIYNVKAVAQEGYEVVGDTTQIVDLTGSNCNSSVTFTYKLADEIVAAKVRKVTYPEVIGSVDQGAGWIMTLSKKNTSGAWDVVAVVETEASGELVTLVDNLDAGEYKIEETMKDGWYMVGSDSDCTFTYDNSARQDYECSFGNAKESKIIIHKEVLGDINNTTFEFTQYIDTDPLILKGGESKTYESLTAGTYDITENDPGADIALTDITCVEYYDNPDTPAVENTITDPKLRLAKIQLDPGETVECTFTNIELLKEPSIVVEKLTNGEDADVAPGLTVPVGDTITWEYIVINNGNVYMNNIVVTDDKEGTITCPSTSLEIGESMTCTASGIAVEGQYQNVGTVTADDPNGTQYTDSDTSHYLGGGTAHIGDFVWYDDNNNGIRDTNEEPVRGFTATLLDANGGVVATQKTDANGIYGFDVPSGTYSVRFSGLTPEYVFSRDPNNSGSSKQTTVSEGKSQAVSMKFNDSAADSNGNTEQITVSAGESRLDMDAGIYCITPKGSSSSSGDAMGTFSAVLMILMTLMAGLFFVRREEQLNKNRM